MVNTRALKFLWYSILSLLLGILAFLFFRLYEWKLGIIIDPVFISLMFFVNIVAFSAILLKFADNNVYILHPLFLFSFIYIFLFFLRPVGFLEGYQGYIHESPLLYINEVFKGYIYAWLGLLMIFLGFFVGNKLKIKSFIIPHFTFSSRSFLKLALITTFLYCILSIYLIFKKGGIIKIFEHRATIFMGSGYILNFTCFLGILSWHLFLFSFKEKYNKQIYKCILFYIFLFLFIINFLLTGARGMILSLILTYLIFRIFILEKKINVSKLIILFIMIVSVAIIGVLIRNPEIWIEGLSFNIVKYNSFLNAFFRLFLPYDGFIEVIKKVPNIINYNYGKTYLDFFIAFIPRVIWHDKPLWGKIIFTKKFFGVEDSIFSYSILGELYWNFGEVGIILGMFMWGGILGYFYKYLISLKKLNKNDFAFFILTSFFYSSLIYQSIRGGIFSGILAFLINFTLFLGFIFSLSLINKVKILIVKL